MARKSNVNRDRNRTKLIESRKAKRDAARKEANAGDMEAMFKLQKMDRNSSYIREVRRCQCCGRPNGTLRRFKMCRMCLRKFAMLGLIPGIKKSSW